jgi:hypothetical protein
MHFLFAFLLLGCLAYGVIAEPPPLPTGADNHKIQDATYHGIMIHEHLAAVHPNGQFNEVHLSAAAQHHEHYMKALPSFRYQGHHTDHIHPLLEHLSAAQKYDVLAQQEHRIGNTLAANGHSVNGEVHRLLAEESHHRFQQHVGYGDNATDHQKLANRYLSQAHKLTKASTESHARGDTQSATQFDIKATAHSQLAGHHFEMAVTHLHAPTSR